METDRSDNDGIGLCIVSVLEDTQAAEHGALRPGLVVSGLMALGVEEGTAFAALDRDGDGACRSSCDHQNRHGGHPLIDWDFTYILIKKL